MDYRITYDRATARKLQNFFEAGLTDPIQEAVNDVAGWSETELQEQASKEVYSLPESASYRRTGALQRGHESNFSRGSKNLKAEVLVDSRIGGAESNYSPAVNDGFTGEVDVRSHKRRTKGGETTVKSHKRSMNMPAKPFIDNAFQATIKKAPQIVSRILSKYINRI